MISDDKYMNHCLSDVKAALSAIAAQVRTAMDSADTETLLRLLKARANHLDSISDQDRESPEYREIIESAVNENRQWLLQADSAKQLIKSKILSIQATRHNTSNLSRSYNTRPASGRIFSKDS